MHSSIYPPSSSLRLLQRFRSLCTAFSPATHQNTYDQLYQCNTKLKDLVKLGKVEDARQLFDEMPIRNSFTWNSMINGYSQIGQIDEARALFDSFSGKNARTWTCIVTGYAKNGRIQESRKLFDMMPERNVVSWNAMINGYVYNHDLVSAKWLFDRMPERNVGSWNTLLTGYCHCGRLDEACKLFDQMYERNLVSWMVMISGHVQSHDFQRGWDLFVKMHCSGLLPDQSIFVVSVSAIIGLDCLSLIEILRPLAVKTSYEEDVVVGTAILNAYSRSGNLRSASKFFEGMPERNDFSWTTMLSAFSRSGRLQDAIALYERVPMCTSVVQTAMLTAYAQHRRIHEARRLFDVIPYPNEVTWNAMVSGYVQSEMFEEATDFFSRMPVRNQESWAALISGFAHKGQNDKALVLLSDQHRCGMVPSPSSFTSALFACANIGAFEKGRQLHALTLKTGCQFNSYVGNGLISMYAKCRDMENVSQDFGTMTVKDTVSWNSLISGLSKNYMLDDARCIFDKMPRRDAVSWTAMISAYAQAGHADSALELFLDMLASGIKPNSSTVTGLLVTCGSLGAINLGRQIHSLIFKLGLDNEVFVGNSLITMYFKCGSMDGVSVFEEMDEVDLVTWNAILIGYAQNGFGKKAVESFELMKASGILPNQISFLGVLCACSHAGLVDEGHKYFKSMQEDYGIMPLEGHYACMVDLLGRAGYIYEAEALIENMLIEPDSVVWAALLGACRIHKNVELGEIVAERLFQLEPQKSGNYILLSNIYASVGMWKEAGNIRNLMKDRGVTKQPSYSWIQIKNKLVCFVKGDNRQGQIEEVFKTLKVLYGRIKEAGYVPDTNFVLQDVEEEQKENALLFHSEKLAIGYGLLNTPEGSPIQIMKNLHICSDCHSFTKFLTKITGREILIRAGNRFHHFRHGSCSCGDYW